MTAPSTAAHHRAAFLDALLPVPLGDGLRAALWFNPPKHTVTAASAAEAAEAVAEHGARADCYVGIALVNGDLPRNRRVTNATAAGLIGIGADLDFAGPDKPGALADEVAALDLLAGLPLLPTLVVHSGHGLQGWWLFREPWLFADEEERDRAARLLRAWGRLVAARAKAAGAEVDSTPDLARLFRVAGTVNVKIPEAPVPTALRSAEGPHHNPDDLLRLPELAGHRAGPAAPGPPPIAAPEQVGSDDDAALLVKMFEAKNGAKVRALFDGDTTGHTSPSEADLALCCHLAFWTAKDSARIDSLFRLSRLYRDKWERADYRDATIAKAIAVTTEVYSPRAAAPGGRGGFHLTDLGNSERVVALHGGEMRYCHPWGGGSQSAQGGWLVWDGQRWRQDDAGLALARAKSLPQAIYQEAADCEDKDRRDAIGDHARRTEARARMVNALALAQSALPVLPPELNRDGWLLNVANGTIDLRTGDLQPHNPEDMLTKLANTTYDPDATCPRWERFLAEVMASDQERVNFLQQAAGYSIIGNTAEHLLMFLYGNVGRNGKSTFLGTMLEALGDYGLMAAHDLLTTMRAGGHERHPTIIADLYGRRFVSTVEVEKGAHMAEALMTLITGGDVISARRMNENPWTFTPTHTIWLAANNLPRIESRTAAVWERIKLVPFDVRFGDGPGFDFPKEVGLEQTLRGEDGDDSPDRGELPGILTWAVEGCLTWQREGLKVPEQIKGAIADYREQQDELAPFFDEECIIAQAATVKFAELWARYTKYCENAGEKPLTKTMLGRELTDRGFAIDETKKGDRWRRGIAVRRAEDDVRRDANGAPSQDH